MKPRKDKVDRCAEAMAQARLHPGDAIGTEALGRFRREAIGLTGAEQAIVLRATETYYRQMRRET